MADFIRAIQDYSPRKQPTGPNEVWSMGFVAEQLLQGTWFPVLMAVDFFTKKCLAIDVGAKLEGRARRRGAPH